MGMNTPWTFDELSQCYRLHDAKGKYLFSVMSKPLAEFIVNAVNQAEEKDSELKSEIVDLKATVRYLKDIFLPKQSTTIKLLVGALGKAKCPNVKCCNGNIPHQIGEDEWEKEQCQWCYEKDQALKGAE